ncbi:uncharacterized protein LOC106052905 [Biomphalaria glabrata]|uniref:Uncharacterized protein LOC106052905 n=1 Tax=Biomphalaria glabrata TaxID=6526 RepID=A0A9W3AJH3_BIOGL|nr:uncharacterized protein LOC106052905 [Biomphalaria glabrata]
MLTNVQHCQAIVQQLIVSETDIFFSNTLSSLSESLSVHSSILTKKIYQIDDKNISKPTLHDNFNGQFTASCRSSTIDSRTDHGNTAELEGQHVKGRRSIIESTVMIAGQIRFGDVVGLTEAKRSLQDSIVLPSIFPHLFTGGRKPWRRILLYGPPGTGKSRLAQAVSTEVTATFYSVSSTDLLSSWVGESEKLIKELFTVAGCQSNQSVIFIDEIDSLCRQRSSREDESSRRVKTELLLQMGGPTEDKVFLLCATNCPWELDTAFLRRFQKRIYIPLPDFTSRIEIMKLHCKGNKVNMTESDWTHLSLLTEGYSGSDLSTLTNGALFQPIRDMQTANYWRESPDGRWVPCDVKMENAVSMHIMDLPPNLVCPRDVQLEDFVQALQVHRPTVSQQELNKFDDFTASYGQSGQ